MAESDWKNVQRNKTTGQYRTTDEGGGGASNFADLEDVDFDNLQDGQVPKYDAQNHKWINSNESGGISDVEVNGISVVDQQDNTAKITSYKEVTQAQYEALPDSKLTDGILYAIKDGGQAIGGFPPLIYSDQEREVGVWRDGKPLYQKTKVFSNISKSGSLSFGVANAESVFVCDIGKGSDAIPLPYVHGSAPSNNIGGFLSISANDVTWEFRSGDAAPSSLSGFMTIRYTKTTDTPGSGIWNSQGAIAHHYSTTEQVIGTWIDGKPIYEKVYDGLSIALGNNNWTNTAIELGVFDKMLDGKTIDNYGQLHQVEVGYDTGANKLAIRAPISGNIANYLIIQYTKTTD